MKEKGGRAISRRTFMGAAASTAFAFSIVPGKVMGKDAPSNKLNIACIGAAGRGWANLRGVEGQNIVALCDVDMVRAKNNFNRYPSVKKFRDFRVMFDKMEKDIDAVIVRRRTIRIISLRWRRWSAASMSIAKSLWLIRCMRFAR